MEIVFNGFVILGMVVFVVGLIILLVRVSRKPRLGANGIPAIKKIVCPSDSKLREWGFQLVPNNFMLDPAEANLLSALQGMVLGYLSMRYGDRFTVLRKVPAKQLFATRGGCSVEDVELLQVINELVADFVVCSDVGSTTPVFAVMMWDGYPQAMANRGIIEYQHLDRKWLLSEEQHRKWTLAGIMQYAGIPVLYADSSVASKIARWNKDGSDVSLQEELTCAIGSIDLRLG